MRLFRALAVACVLVPAAPATAQIHGPNAAPLPGASAHDLHRHDADRNLMEMQRLRMQADQREALAVQQRLEARLTGLRLQSARGPEPVTPYPYAAPRSEADERAARLAATERRKTSGEAVGQIDAWLDRPNR